MGEEKESCMRRESSWRQSDNALISSQPAQAIILLSQNKRKKSGRARWKRVFIFYPKICANAYDRHHSWINYLITETKEARKGKEAEHTILLWCSLRARQELSSEEEETSYQSSLMRNSQNAERNAQRRSFKLCRLSNEVRAPRVDPENVCEVLGAGGDVGAQWVRWGGF